jgi:3-oxoacyl-[acyl-carrier protein] reductase
MTAATSRGVIVTGAGSGMGAAMVERFAAQGDRVAALDWDLDAAKQVVGRLPAGAGEAIWVDVGDPVAVERAVGEATTFLGAVDVLCSNAGVLDNYRAALDTTVESWDRILRTNLTGPFLLARAVLPQMIERGGGVIINTASISAFVAGGGGAAYTASKHGILGLTKQLAFDYGRHNVRVNAICPGAVRTGMTEHLFTEDGRQAHVDAAIAGTPAGRWAEPSEIAEYAAFLASDAAAFSHGAAYVVDGGWTIS